MTITDRTRKLLWGRAANRCAICRRVLSIESAGNDQTSVVGEECHIVAQSAGGPRYRLLAAGQVDDYENLLVLCRVHHKQVDDQPKYFDENRLREIKAKHEEWVRTALGDGEAVQEISAEDQSFLDDALPVGVPSETLFSWRLAEAFPGVRGLSVIDQPETALDRLDIMFRAPLGQRHVNPDGSFRTSYPFWWFRGPTNMYVPTYERLDKTTCLLAGHELAVNRIAAFRHPARAMWEFLYVEVFAQEPSGAYQYASGEIERTLRERRFGNFVDEEYGVWQGRPITAEEYDDGVALIDGVPTKVSGAQWRRRYLTPFNLLFCANRNVINGDPDLDYQLLDKLDRILDGGYTIEDLSMFISRLRRPTRYLSDGDQ